MIRWVVIRIEFNSAGSFARLVGRFHAECAGIPISGTACLVCPDQFVVPFRRGWHLADHGAADHPADAAVHPGFLFDQRPSQILHDPVLPAGNRACSEFSSCLDLLLFFVFWEFGLVPMYFLINQWGSEKGEREIWGGRKVPARTYASFKFMIYTMAGSLGLLLAIQMIGVVCRDI